MARPREFDEEAVLDAAVACFWSRGYEGTTVRDLIASTGLTGASLYNAFGDKQSLFQTALDRFVVHTIDERIMRCEAMPPRKAIETFFEEVLTRSLTDRERKGCMLVNSAIDGAAHDAHLQKSVVAYLTRIEMFFRKMAKAGQKDGTINRSLRAEDIASNLLAVLVGLRVLARVRPERALLAGVVAPALALLDNG